MQVASCTLHLDEVGDDLVEQSLALMVTADRKAPQGVPEAAARADDFVIFIEHGTDIVQVPVPADASRWSRASIWARVPLSVG